MTSHSGGVCLGKHHVAGDVSSVAVLPIKPAPPLQGMHVHLDYCRRTITLSSLHRPLQYSPVMILSTCSFLHIHMCSWESAEHVTSVSTFTRLSPGHIPTAALSKQSARRSKAVGSAIQPGVLLAKFRPAPGRPWPSVSPHVPRRHHLVSRSPESSTSTSSSSSLLVFA